MNDHEIHQLMYVLSRDLLVRFFFPLNPVLVTARMHNIQQLCSVYLSYTNLLIVYFSEPCSDAFDRATRAGNQQLKASQIFCGQSLLQRIAPRSGAEISSRFPGHVCDMRSPGHRISCLIDGDGNIFSTHYLVKGIQGGYEAAEALTQLVHRYFPSGPGQKKHTLQVWVFLNQQGLRKTLAECGNMAAALNFDNFVRGFNQASRLFNIVDVGAVKEGADRKMTGVW